MRFHPRSRVETAALTLAALVAATPSVAALELRGARVVREARVLSVTLAVERPFGERARDSLTRGMPASLEITADLWRHRPGWFDEHVAARTVMVRVRYDAWQEGYDLQVDLRPAELRASLADVELEISAERRVPLLPLAGLRSGERYYVVCTARARPLTPESLRQVEEFLAAQARPESAGWLPSLPGLGRLPGPFVSLLGALSGFGEESARAVTSPFVAP